MDDKVVRQIHPHGLVLPSLPGQVKELRVAAYARVSTSSEEQLNSVEAQKDYFEKLILRKPGWGLVGIYADEGITRTSMHRREAFKRMIADAMDGKIDLIVTKSLSRFARNTVDSLNIIRQLKDVRVGVYFEKEDIFTLDSKGEFMITLLSSMAEEESRSISENIKWGHRKRFADGRHSVGYKNFLGFQKGPDGSLEILEEEAQIVRLIYLLFLEGYSPNAIAAILTAAGIPTPTGKQLWPSSTILGVLTNEKHYGAALLQKEFFVDYRTKKKKRNCGELPMYYIANDHPGIVSKEIFDEVQRRLSQLQSHTKSSTLFAGQLYFSDCGGAYGPKLWHSTSYADTVWQCGNRHDHSYPCTTPHLYEELLKPVFHEVILKLLETHSEILRDCMEALVESGTSLSQEEILAAITEADISSAAEKHIWRSVIKKVIVYPGHLLEFHFLDGSTISHQMTRTGLRRQRMTQAEKEQVWRAYLAGKSGKAIAREMGFHPTTIYGFLLSKNAIIHYSDQGLPVNSCNSEGVVRYLTDYENENKDVIPFTRSISRIGWLGREFYPYAVGSEIVFEDTEHADLVHALQEQGDYDLWLQTAAELRKNPFARALLAASFASPLLEPLQHRVILLHCWHASRSGKTATLKFALSAWGDPIKLMGSFNTTAVGLERRAATLRHLPFGLDELQVLNERKLAPSQIVYSLGNGSGKTRGSRNGKLQETPTWRSCIISTGEQPISSENSMDGVHTRVLELYGQPIADPEFGRSVHQISESTYGFAGKWFILYIQQILSQRGQMKQDFASLREQLKDRFPTDPGVHLDNIAALSLADFYVPVSLFGLDADAAHEEALELGVALLTNAKSLEQRDSVERAWDFVKDWIAANRNKFGHAAMECFGIIEAKHVYVLASKLRQALEDAGLSYTKSIKGFRERGYLVTATDSDGKERNQCQKRIQGVNTRAFCLNITVGPTDFDEDDFLV